MITLNNSLQNVMAATKFIRAWGKKVKHHSTSMCLFRCLVSYTSRDKKHQVETVAKIHTDGIDAGKVSLDETDDFSVDDFHLDFSPDFQSYKINDANILVISGSSPKMSGKYSVQITPIEAVDPLVHYGVKI